MYSTDNEGKSVIAERFFRTLKNRIYKYMTSISKNVYIDKLDKYNNICHSTIKKKPFDVKPSRYIESSKEDPKFKIGDTVRISKYKSIFAKGYFPNWSEKLFRGHILLVILKENKLSEGFTKNIANKKSKRV